MVMEAIREPKRSSNQAVHLGADRTLRRSAAVVCRGREGAQRLFMPAPTQHTLGMLAANAPEDIRTGVTRLPAYATR
ncbi:hypothetical protein E7X58_00055 [Streptomyces sp. A1499]|nr:hypothetical protein ADL30_03445 [Streptomyces sp. NRRL S-1521]THC54788.1 hypothetical protein E7X58_00055 [Streptomyces sp. A1499]